MARVVRNGQAGISKAQQAKGTPDGEDSFVVPPREALFREAVARLLELYEELLINRPLAIADLIV